MSPQSNSPGAQPHHDGSPVYVSQPHPRLGDRVWVRVRVPQESGVDTVALRTTHDGEQRFFSAARVTLFSVTAQ